MNGLQRDWPRKIYLPKEKRDFLIEESSRVYYESNFCFQKTHNGFRPGYIHILLGPTSSGKSTVVRSIVLDFVKSNPEKKLFVWLSEESVHEFERELAAIKDLPDSPNIYVVSDMDLEEHQRNMIYLTEYIGQCNPDFIIFDNLTTSRFYSTKRPYEQIKFVDDLKEIIKKRNCPLLLVAHTEGKIGESYCKIIGTNDIRGNKHPSNIAEFFYAIQKIQTGKRIDQVIIVHKYRGQNPTDFYFKLCFDYADKICKFDEPLTFQEFKEVFKGRNIL